MTGRKPGTIFLPVVSNQFFPVFLLSSIAITAGAAEPAAPCPHKAGTTAGSGQKAGESQMASTRTETPSLRAETMPRLSSRVDAGSRRAGNPPYQHGHRRVAARRPREAGAGPSARALPTRRARVGAGTYDRPRVQAAPGSAAEVRHGEQVEQRGAERDAE